MNTMTGKEAIAAKPTGLAGAPPSSGLRGWRRFREFLQARDVFQNRMFRQGILSFFVVVILLLLLFSFRFLFAVVLLILVSIIIGFALRPFRSLSLGVEVGLFATVVSSMTHGIKAGIIVGLAVLTAKLIAEGSLSVYSLVIYPSHLIVAVMAGLFADASVVTVGIAAALFHNLFTGILSFFFLGAPASKVFIYTSTNILFNLLLFSAVGPAVIRLLTAG